MFLKNNFKRVTIGLLVIMILSYGIGCFILLKSPNKVDIHNILEEFNGLNINIGNWGNFNDASNYNIDETQTHPMDNIENLDINLVSGNINVISYDGTDIKATLKGSVKGNWGNDLPKLQLTSSNNTIFIKFERSNGLLNGINITSRLQLDVYIPNKFNGNALIKGVSSDIKADNLNTKNLTINTVSGDTTVSNITTSDFKFNSVSGKLLVENLTSTNNEVKTTSGNMTLNNILGDLNFQSISGDVNSTYKSFDGNKVNGKLTSGKANIILPNESSFYVNCSTTSGSLNIDFPVTVNGSMKKSINGEVGNSSNKGKIEISTISGNINIKK